MTYVITIAVTIVATLLIGAVITSLHPSKVLAVIANVVVAMNTVWTNVLVFGEKLRAKIGKAFNPED